MKYYPNGENGYSAYDDNWKEVDKFPAKDVTPVERIMRRFPLGQAKMPSGASGAQIGTALGKAFGAGAGRNRGPDGGDDQIIGAKTGEFVVNDKSARIFGYDNLEKINNLGKDGGMFSLSSGDINPTTYGPTSPGATPADKQERIGAFDNRLKDKVSVGVNPRNPWGIKPGPGVRLNIDGRLYNVDDYTHPRVPANTVDFYHGYPGGAGQLQRYARGGEVGEGGGGGGGTGDTHGFYDRTGTYRGYNPNYEPGPLAGNIGTMWSGQGRFGPWGMFNTANPLARPWLDKMYPGRGNPRGGGGYAEGGRVGGAGDIGRITASDYPPGLLDFGDIPPSSPPGTSLYPGHHGSWPPWNPAAPRVNAPHTSFHGIGQGDYAGAGVGGFQPNPGSGAGTPGVGGSLALAGRGFNPEGDWTFNTNQGWYFKRPLDKMFKGRGSQGSYQEGGVVEGQSDTLPEPLAAAFLSSEGSGASRTDANYRGDMMAIANERMARQEARLNIAEERYSDEERNPSAHREDVTPIPNSNFVNDDIKSIEMRINGEHWEVPTRIPGWENFWGLADTNIHPEDWPIDYQNAIEDRARQNIEQGRSPFEEPVDDVSELEPKHYAKGGRVGGMGRRPRGYRAAARRNAMAYAGPAVEILTDRRDLDRGRIDPGDAGFFPPDYDPPFPSWPNYPNVPPPAYTDDETNPTNPGLPPPYFSEGLGGGYVDLSGFPGISGAGTPSQTELALYGGPAGTQGDYFIPFWANQS